MSNVETPWSTGSMIDVGHVIAGGVVSSTTARIRHDVEIPVASETVQLKYATPHSKPV